MHVTQLIARVGPLMTKRSPALDEKGKWQTMCYTFGSNEKPIHCCCSSLN